MRDQATHGQATRNRGGTEACNRRATAQFGFNKNRRPDTGPALHHRAQSGERAQCNQYAAQPHATRPATPVLARQLMGPGPPFDQPDNDQGNGGQRKQ